mgnify:CR=1 FL=1
MNKRLYRSRQDVVIAGVAAGLAEYFQLDVSLIRVIWGIAGFMGFGVFAYLIAWIIIPQEPGDQEYIETAKVGNVYEPELAAERQRSLGLILVVLGLIVLARRAIPNYVFAWTWPLVLIILGVYLLTQNRKGK